MIQWFKKHPQYLKQLSNELSSDANYKENCQFRNNFFISHGNIIVRLQQIYRFPILIVYTNATPFALPEIYPLQKEFDASFIEHLSQLQHLHEIREVIKNHIELYPYLRHQNASGNICILEWDNLDTGVSFYGSKTILNRIKEWFSGTITKKFPPESAETELIGHFNNVDYSVYFLYNQELLNPSYKEGDAYAYCMRHIPTTLQTAEKRVYFNVHVTGLNHAGVIETNNSDVPPALQALGLKNFTDLYKNSELLRQKKDGKELINFFWFSINTVPAPFQHFSELLTLLGDNNQESGLMRFYKRTYSELKMLPDEIYVGLRFPHGPEAYEFQLFKITKSMNNRGILLQGTEKDIAEQYVSNYHFLQIIPCEKFTEEDFYIRNKGRINQSALKEQTVIAMGLGALGSEIADCITKAGIGRIFLIDNQNMKAHNAVRHIGSVEDVGLPKTWVLQKSIHLHNPYVEAISFPTDVFNVDFSTMAEKVIIISTIADDNTECYINEQALLTNQTVYYARALRGGKAARIFRVIPGQDACMYCMQLYRNDKKEFIIIPDDPALPTIRNECNNPIRPASAADLKLIAALASRIFIDQVQSNSGENHWIWTSESIPGLPQLAPFSVTTQVLLPHVNCVYCSHPQKIRVSIPAKVLQLMQKLVEVEADVETGGVLAGRKDSQGNIKITHASGPGPKALRSKIKFEKDVLFCQQFLDELYMSDNNIEYVGEWHSHPSVNSQPSGVDIKSLSEIAAQPNYLTQEPVMIILANNGDPSCTVHPVGKTFYHTELMIEEGI